MTKLRCILLPVLFSSLVHAHGDNELGPNKGIIRMPGAFHTELVPVNETQFKIYLLDIDIKNPSMKDSALDVTFEGKSISKVKCAVDVNFYLCQLPANQGQDQKGTLVVNAQREKMVGNKTTYPWPIKIPKK